jgi:MFS family permease
MARKRCFSLHTTTRLLSLPALLLAVELCDEAISGIPAIGLPLARQQLGLNYAQIGLIFSAAGISSLVFEPAFNLFSDHGSRRRWMVAGFAALVASYVLAGGVTGFVPLALAFAVMFPATGAVLGLAQAALIDLMPGNPTRAMLRWVAFGSIGDLVAPLATTSILALGLGWRGLCWIGASIWSALALAIGSRRFPKQAQPEGDDPAIGLLAGFRTALRNPLLLRWGALSIIPTMMDEILLTFATLYLHDTLHANPLTVGVILAAMIACGMLVLATMERLAQRRSLRRWLPVMALVTLIGIAGFLLAPAIWLAAIALCVANSGAVGWYPLAKAVAYETLPGRSGTVRAVIGLGQPFEIVLPAIVGFIAARFGAWGGVAALGTAPLLVLALFPWREIN